MRDRCRRAPAKLTLSLRVMGRRDDGYHLIDAEMTTLELADELRFSAGGNDLPPDDLVSRALVAVGHAAGVRVEVDKHIPVGAGLGGGSADAAAVLRWAGCADLELAAGLGADVAFCLVGGRARVGGIGEVVEPLPMVDTTFTLLTPPFPVWTPLVYRAWDDMGGPSGESGNDLEPAALRVEPRLVRWRDRLGDATGLTPRLAGSGGTWFVEGSHPEVDGAVVTRTGRP
ncbi:MAG TPA: 4-(cytidine 5'-diphospho)-2-C-methyl-D-erythritol kinase [Acidimicrobiales bacterium]|nr:4-(cytidine 5'-diphospho)-2-C-methyl-D-erythritol kinase [Acidimicrobiales bacterium]